MADERSPNESTAFRTELFSLVVGGDHTCPACCSLRRLAFVRQALGPARDTFQATVYKGQPREGRRRLWPVSEGGSPNSPPTSTMDFLFWLDKNVALLSCLVPCGVCVLRERLMSELLMCQLMTLRERDSWTDCRCCVVLQPGLLSFASSIFGQVCGGSLYFCGKSNGPEGCGLNISGSPPE